MALRQLTFRIWRYTSGQIDPPGYQDFRIELEPSRTVLDGLETIRLTQDAGLIYRHCCHHASCGTCACTINGIPALACTTRIETLEDEVITLSPLDKHRCIGDLAVDVTSFFEKFDPHWAGLKVCANVTAERKPAGIDQLKQLENCIECGCCVSACPVVSSPDHFLGPAVLAAINNERRNRPERNREMLKLAALANGAAKCRRHIACSHVCPSKVYPARHIAELLRTNNDRSNQ